MQTYSWSDTVTPNNNASLDAGIVFFSPSAFGAQEQCKIRAFTVRSRSNDWDPLVSTTMYAKIIDLANDNAVLAVSNGQAMTAYNHDYTFTFAECPWLARTTQYGIIFASGTADDAPMVKSGLRLAVMATAQDIYYGDANDIHGATWRPITGFVYQIGGELELKVWNGWDFQNLGKGPRGAIGPQGTYGEVGVGGETGPTGADGLVGPQGLQGNMVAGHKGHSGFPSYSEGVADETQYIFAGFDDFSIGVSQGERVHLSLIGEATPTSNLHDGVACLNSTKNPSFSLRFTINGKIVVRSWRTYNGIIPSPGMVGSPADDIINIDNARVTHEHLDTDNDQIADLYLTGAGYRLRVSFFPAVSIWHGILTFILGDNAGIKYQPYVATYTPPRYYLQRQVDETPDEGEARAAVTSGGVAKAYCDLIDAIGAATTLPAATIAQMKALYGA